MPGLRRGLPGIAYIVNKAHVPVVPVGVIGTTSDALDKALKGTRPLLQVRVGPPVDLPPLQDQHTTPETRHLMRQQNIDLVMMAIAALLPPDYRGEYLNPEEVHKVAAA
jgi:1-acyl-sn-glycerol-3-phosphate acyltransferase